MQKLVEMSKPCAINKYRIAAIITVSEEMRRDRRLYLKFKELLREMKIWIDYVDPKIYGEKLRVFFSNNARIRTSQIEAINKFQDRF